MSGKWKRVDPADVRVGDRVKVKTSNPETVIGRITEADDSLLWMGLQFDYRNQGTWYIRKPKKAKPPTRPDEPPVGSFFRVDRTGESYQRYKREEHAYLKAPCTYGAVSRAWSEITEPGDTIKMLKLVEDKPRTNGGFPG